MVKIIHIARLTDTATSSVNVLFLVICILYIKIWRLQLITKQNVPVRDKVVLVGMKDKREKN